MSTSSEEQSGYSEYAEELHLRSNEVLLDLIVGYESNHSEQGSESEQLASDLGEEMIVIHSDSSEEEESKEEIEIPMPPLVPDSPRVPIALTVPRTDHSTIIYQRNVMAIVRNYTSIVFERMTREGNYGYIFSDLDDDEINVFGSVEFPEYQIGLETVVKQLSGTIYYFIQLFIIRPAPLSKFFIRSLEIWNHPSDTKEVEFKYYPNELHDNLTYMRLSIVRWSTYFPYRSCPSEDCQRILLPSENVHCFECTHSIRTHLCSICLDDQTPQRLLTTVCRHTFHHNCFRQIISHQPNKVKCPMCRTVVDAASRSYVR